MARRSKPPRADLDKPGQPPLLQGHLRPGGVRAGSDATAESTAGGPPAQPSDEVASASADAAAARGKSTKSAEDVATRPHLEGAEQGPA